MSRLESVGPVVERLLADETIHERLATAAANLRAARGRARGKGADAVGDQRLLAQLATTAAALRAAYARSLGRPEPEPERVGGAGSVLLLIAGAGLLVEGLRGSAA